jgi:hypothetical protein
MHHRLEPDVLGARDEFGVNEPAIRVEAEPKPKRVGFTADETGAGMRKLFHAVQ